MSILAFFASIPIALAQQPGASASPDDAAAPTTSAEPQETIKNIIVDTPESGFEYAVFIGLGALLIFVIIMYIQDARELHPFWGIWLCVLRLCAVACLIVIALNPQERERKKVVRDSKVVILADTTMSMRFPLRDPTKSMDAKQIEAAKKYTRAMAVQDLLKPDSAFVKNLQAKHNVYVYTFGTNATGPVHQYPFKNKAVAKVEEKEPADPADPKKGTDKKKEPKDPDAWRKTGLAPTLTATDLNAPLKHVLQEQASSYLAGIIVISEGQHNSGTEPLDDVKREIERKEIPLVTIGTGGQLVPKSFAISSVQAPTEVRLGDPFPIDIYVNSRGLLKNDPRQFSVKLLGKPEGSKDDYAEVGPAENITLQPDGTSGKINFKLRPTKPVSMRYKVEVSPLGRIPGLEDPVQSDEVTVNIVERNTGVLIIAGGPMRDYRFVRNMLHRHPGYDVDVWLQSVDHDDEKKFKAVSQDCDILYEYFPTSFPLRPLEKQLKGWDKFTPEQKKYEAKQYDIVIAFDPNWFDNKGFAPDSETDLARVQEVHKISEWVVRESGGLILVAGDVNTAQITKITHQVLPEKMVGFNNLDEKLQKKLRDFSVEDFYPIRLSPYAIDSTSLESENAFGLRFLPAAQTADFMEIAETPQQSAEDWQSFKGIFGCYQSLKKKDLTKVYAEYTDPQAIGQTGSRPIWLCSMPYGTGQVYYMGSPEAWRLRELSEEHFDRFWLKLSDAAGQGRRQMGSAQTLSMMDKRYLLEGAIPLKFRLQDKNRQPIPQETLEIRLVGPDGRDVVPPPVLKKTLDQDTKEETAIFTAEFRPAKPGDYEIFIENPTESKVRKFRIKVESPVKEDLDRRQNIVLLQELAEKTGGIYLDYDEAVKRERAALKRRGADNPDDPQGDPNANTEPNPEAERAAAAADIEKAISELLESRREEDWMDKQLTPLWDKEWAIWLLVILLSLEWLTRKLLKLA